jgi:Flp pilus assembly protein TadG
MPRRRFSLSNLIGRFRRDRKGTFTVQMALFTVPLIAGAGAAIDYGYLVDVRARLSAAADTAALAAISRSSSAATADDAKKAAQNAFSVFAQNLGYTTIDSLDIQVSDDGLGRTAVVNYTATVKTSVMNVVGIKTMTFRGQATSALSRSPYIDFYLVLDNSPSMGVGATPTDVATMVNNTSDKCAFACHDLSNSNNYYNKAKSLGVTMRIDVLRQATQKLMDTAKSTATLQDQFRMAIYTFGAKAESLGLTNVQALTTDLDAAKAAAGTIDLMTVPSQNYNNDTQSPFTAIMNSLNTTIPSPGNGAWSTTPQKVLFLVSDGVADEVNKTTCTRPLTGTRCQQPMNPALCQQLKSRGIKIAVLYTTYLPLPTNSWYNTWIAPFSSTIGTNMQSCATPGLYFEVSPTQGISDAMTALFQLSIASARLTS